MLLNLEGILTEIHLPNTISLKISKGLELELIVPFKYLEFLKSRLGSSIKCYTYFIIKKDGSLEGYGFIKREERELFLALTKLSNVGLRLAYNLVSVYSLTDLKRIVEQDNIESLSLVPGIGKKRAKRILVELKDKLVDKELHESKTGEVVREVIECLKNLGFKSSEVKPIVLNQASPEDDVETLLKRVLKILSPLNT